MNDERIILAVAEELQRNAKAEAEASQFYTMQLSVILKAIEEIKDEELREYLQKLYDATEEKIQDELSHSASLLIEYEELTGIIKKEG